MPSDNAPSGLVIRHVSNNGCLGWKRYDARAVYFLPRSATRNIIGRDSGGLPVAWR